MKLTIAKDKEQLGQFAARDGAAVLRTALKNAPTANIILATGASQFATLAALIAEPDVAWHRVSVFHLDEYVGLPVAHPASFRKYLWERFHRLLPVPLRAFHYIDAETNPKAECERIGELIRQNPIDVAFVGIGENGHLAFNDPPADFQTELPYVLVDLDDACRRQQQGEGWFPTIDDVPRRAISMSCRQILKARHIVCSVPDQRKAQAVKGTVEGPVTPDVPASILQTHSSTTLYLDPEASGLLSRR
jgi:glucosamine-6-phosphate deaminase